MTICVCNDQENQQTTSMEPKHDYEFQNSLVMYCKDTQDAPFMPICITEIKRCPWSASEQMFRTGQISVTDTEALSGW